MRTSDPPLACLCMVAAIAGCASESSWPASREACAAELSARPDFLATEGESTQLDLGGTCAVRLLDELGLPAEAAADLEGTSQGDSGVTTAVSGLFLLLAADLGGADDLLAHPHLPARWGGLLRGVADRHALEPTGSAGELLYVYVVDRIDAARIDGPVFRMELPAGVLVVPEDGEHGGAAAGAGVLVHEAAHQDYSSHTGCPDAWFAQEDSTWDSVYGVHYFLLSWLRLHGPSDPSFLYYERAEMGARLCGDAEPPPLDSW